MTTETFEADARRLGLAPHEVTELTGLRASADCAGVRARMAELVEDRLAAVQVELGEGLVAQAAAGGVGAGIGVGPIAVGIGRTRDAARLQNASAVLADPPEDGQFNDDCACTRAAAGTGGVHLLPGGDAATASEPLVCTLDTNGGDMTERLDQWRAVLAQAIGREAVDGGVAVTFDHNIARTAELARLLAAEYACCSFASYHLTVDGRGVRMEVRAPAGAGDAIAAVFGSVG